MSRSQTRFVETLAREKGLTIVGPDALTVRRQRCGTGFTFRLASGAVVRNREDLSRLKALAVPPAYTEVRFAPDASAHLQAVGTDAAGRLQYRYHPKWTEVREALKARRLASLARSLPDIERAIAKALHGETVDASFVLAAVVRLVSLTAIRAGGEAYAREHGTRGATTLLKSNVKTIDGAVMLQFKAKGGKPVSKEVRDARLCAAVEALMMRPNAATTFSNFDLLPVTMQLPAGFPRDAILRTDDPDRILPAHIVAPHLDVFEDLRAKELLITPNGVRLVWLLAEANRARYGVLRDADFGDIDLDPALLLDLLDRLVALRSDILSFSRQEALA